jgi:hypothetical protein
MNIHSKKPRGQGGQALRQWNTPIAHGWRQDACASAKSTLAFHQMPKAGRGVEACLGSGPGGALAGLWPRSEKPARDHPLIRQRKDSSMPVALPVPLIVIDEIEVRPVALSGAINGGHARYRHGR